MAYGAAGPFSSPAQIRFRTPDVYLAEVSSKRAEDISNMKIRPHALLTPLAMLCLLVAPSAPLFASSHREAPITALDQKADITDWYCFIDPGNPGNVVMILNVDPFLEPSNGPNFFPFDPN